MAKSFQSIRGMHDVLPDESPRWHVFEDVVRQLMSSYGYSEIRTPLVESTDLFCRSIGDVTDIVEKEMYTFEDRNGDMLSLRPEATASCVRAGIQHGILHNQIRRLWYSGPMFRHERPQKGRYRQFHQFGAEVFGVAEAEIDAELILMTARLWRELGLKDIRLELNTLGSSESRESYREVLVDYLRSHSDDLDEASLKRVDTNPLRVLDSKNSEMEALIKNAPNMHDYLDADSKQHFDTLRQYLDATDISYTINPALVRGLDYYCKTVFEWVTDKLGAQGTVCAGGRYDGLVKQLGGKETPAAGFALGIERLLSLMEESGVSSEIDKLDVYLMSQDVSNSIRSMELAEFLRDKFSKLKLVTNCGDGSLKSKMKKADKSGARFALIVDGNKVTVNYLRDEEQDEQHDKNSLLEFLKSKI
jgi:histidyl-tRNA synthetase